MSDLTLHYAPRTRSFTALWLLEELGVPYVLESFSLAEKRQKSPEHLALNPMGKVPVVVDRGRGRSPRSARSRSISRMSTVTPRSLRRWTTLGAPIFYDGASSPARSSSRRSERSRSSGRSRPSSVAWGSFEQMLDVAKAGVEPGAVPPRRRVLGVRCARLRRAPLRYVVRDDPQRGADQRVCRTLHGSSCVPARGRDRRAGGQAFRVAMWTTI